MSNLLTASDSGTTKSRLNWIDSLKGFTILTVVLGHVASEYANIGELADFLRVELLIRNVIYSFHMPLFVLISGFVFSLAYVKSDGQVKKEKINLQLGNIAFIYVFWNSLSCLSRIIFSSHVHNGASIKTLLMFPLKAVDPFWYLYVLFFCYLVTELIAKSIIEKRSSFYAIFAVSIALCFAHIYVNHLFHGLTVSKLLLYYFFFILGFFLNRNPKALQVIGHPICIVLHLAVGTVLMASFVLRAEKAVTWNQIKIFGVIMAYALSVGIFGTAKALSDVKIKPKTHFFSFVGKYSLEIYTIHCFLTTLIRMVLHKLPAIPFAVNIGVNFACAVAVPIAIAFVLKKVKLHGIFFAPLTWVKNLKKIKPN